MQIYSKNIHGDEVKKIPPHHYSSTELSMFNRKYYRRYLDKLDGCLFVFAAVIALVAAILFTASQINTRFNCLLFGRMFELRRIVIPGSMIPCGFYVVTLYVIAILSFVIACKAASTSTFLFHKTWQKLLMVTVPLILLIDIFFIKQGLQSFCDTFEVNRICESEVFRNTDFRAFQPKHLDASSFHDDCLKALFFCAAILLLWLLSVFVHYRKHKKSLRSSLPCHLI